MRHATILAVWAVAGCLALPAWARPDAEQAPSGDAAADGEQSPAVLLEKGIYAEETAGDLDEAIRIYKRIVARAADSRQYAAQAQYRLGTCYRKKGQDAAAVAAFRELISAYGDQEELVARARTQLAELSGDAADLLPEPVIRYIVDRYRKTMDDAFLTNTSFNAHIYVVDDQFRLRQGGLLPYKNTTTQPQAGPIHLGNFGPEKPDYVLLDEVGQPQEYEVLPAGAKPGEAGVPSAPQPPGVMPPVPVPGGADGGQRAAASTPVPGSRRWVGTGGYSVSRWSLWWTPDEPVPPGATRLLTYFRKEPRTLTNSRGKALMRMENHYGSEVLEDFYLVLPAGIRYRHSSAGPVPTKMIGDRNVYLWQARVPTDETHRVSLQLERTDRVPRVVRTSPEALSDAVDPSLTELAVTFDRPMTDGSWSWTGGGDTFPEVTGDIHYDATRTTCTMPVRLKPGKVYWVGINSPSHQSFRSADGTPVPWYAMPFATASAGGQPTPLPADVVQRATSINAEHPGAAETASGQGAAATGAQPQDAESLAAAGWALWRERKFADAEQKFHAAVTADPDDANAWNGLGWSQFNQGKPANAKEAFSKAVELDPSAAASWNGLGWIAKGQEKTDEAIGHWTKAVAALPTATAAWNGLATTYAELGRYDEAADAYRNWLKAEPNNADAKSGLQKALAAAEAVQAAVPAAEQWLELLDDGEFDEAWDQAASYLKGVASKESFLPTLRVVRDSVGAVRSREVESATFHTSMPGAPDGEYVIIRFKTAYRNKADTIETVTPMKEKDGKWKVSGYFFK